VNKAMTLPELEPLALQRAGRKIATNGIELDVLVMGEGPDVLLVHGFPDDRSVWRKQIPTLVAVGYRVIAPDTRGCGESEAPRDRRAYRIQEHVADLAGVLDALGVDKVKLVGHDWGAALCWQFCFAHPERVERYAALSVGHPNAYAKGPLEQKLKSWYVLAFQVPGLTEWALRAGRWWMVRALTAHAEAAHWVTRLARPGRLTAALNYYRANLGIILPRNYPPITMPVLGVHSSGDRFLAERQMLDTARYVKGPWRFAGVAGASHWLQLDAPERVNALLLEFLASA
jgi:pimeloyl-ACP methyl ester carboxylesterase